MEIKIDRRWKKTEYTISRVFVNGKYFSECIEDTDRGLDDSMSIDEILKKKVRGKTAIPTGRYMVVITFSPRFKRNLPLLTNVKGFSGIRIHPGNRAEDTEGCLLMGKNTMRGMVTQSRTYTNRLIDMIAEALSKKEQVWVDIHH